MEDASSDPYTTTMTAAVIDHDRLDRLDRLERLERREALERREEQQRRQARAATLAAADARDMEDAVAVGSQALNELVDSLGQTHLIEAWHAATPAASKRRLLEQLTALERTTPGGLCDYVRRAQRLLEASSEGRNPFDGYVPSVPSGYTLALGSPEFLEFERIGAKAAAHTAFVLVAGGLGERLGYSGVKLALPSEMLSGICYLELYVRHILALERLSAADGSDSDSGPSVRRRIPLIIMTSDDTDAPTRALLAERGRFGLAESQLHLIKQAKVPCLADGAARLALDPHDPFALLTKPHGHGDVHSLLHTSGLGRALLADGVTHLVFLQDTNALVFGGVPAAIGVSVARGLVMNTISVPRRAGDASGALMRLTRAAVAGGGGGGNNDGVGRSVTVNVEYNQLDALVRASLDARGDYNEPGSGCSPFPGNSNQLIFALAPYVEALEASGGLMPEFVNPKYTDGTRTAFKSPTRLECMMQVRSRIGWNPRMSPQ